MDKNILPSDIQILYFALRGNDWSVVFSFNIWIAIAAFVVSATFLIWRWRNSRYNVSDFEIDQAEIGIGSQKLRLKPNITDRQVAYAIWVELSTRKIGLEIDFEHDSIAEIYDSWYTYFSVTRELIKGISVTQVKNDSTQKIISMSIEVLNQGLRPHLTRWQSRFRRWYERELKKYDSAPDDSVLDPQDIQKKFPKYEELQADMEAINKRLIAYRRDMRRLVFTDS